MFRSFPRKGESSSLLLALGPRSRGRAGLMLRLVADRSRIEHIALAAEFAGHRDRAVFHHVVAVVLREAAQHGLHTVARAGALRVQRKAVEHPHAALVE